MAYSLFLSYLFHLSYFISLPISFTSMVFMLPWGVCHRSFKVTRRVFNLSQRCDSLAFPLFVGRWNFQVVVNGKTPIGSSQMDTVKNQGAFYKQANAYNDAEKHARASSRNGYFVLERATKSCRLWLAISAPYPERTEAWYASLSSANTGAFTRRVISIRGRKRARARWRDL